MSDTGLDIATLVISSLTLLIILIAAWFWSALAMRRKKSTASVMPAGVAPRSSGER